MSFDLAQTDKLLTTTRSVRKRLDLTRPVPRDVVLECIDIAVQAPTGGNRQPWRWLVIDDPDVIGKLAAIYRKLGDSYLAEGRKVAESSGNLGAMDSILTSSEHLNEHLHEVPMMVIPCLLDRLAADVRVMDTAGFYGSVLPSAWSFMLALRSRGFGSAWTTLHLAHEREAAEVLGIPDTVTQTVLLPVAYFTGDDFKPARRKPASEVTYFNAWKQRA